MNTVGIAIHDAKVQQSYWYSFSAMDGDCRKMNINIINKSKHIANYEIYFFTPIPMLYLSADAL